MRAVLIDDERLARRELRALLTSHDTIDIVGEASSIEQAIDAVAQLRPDVIFLDVQLNPGTGFDLLERLVHPVRIVFVTAFDTFALRAFEVNALDYLLKPINPQRLAQAVSRLTAGAGPGPHAPGDENTAAVAQTAPPQAPSGPPSPLTLDDRLLVEAHGRSRFLRVADIVSIAAEGDYSQVRAADGQRWLVLRSLREWEQRLPADPFARIHRSIIVNLDYVDRLEAAFTRGYLVHLRGSSEPVPMSRRRAAEVKRRLGAANR